MQKVVMTLIGLVFLTVMFGGIFQVTHSMNMNNGMSGCAFMAPGESVCSMSVVDHLEFWKATFLSIIPVMTLFSVLLAALVFATSVVPEIFFTKKQTLGILRIYCTQRIYRCSQRPLQELFSNGILHPKLF